MTLPGGKDASYSFCVGGKPQGRFEIQDERCCIRSDGARRAEYHVHNGRVKDATFHPPPPASNDRLYLTIASGFIEFRELFDHLSGMGFCNISPDQLRDLQEPGAGNLLERDGRNAASVIAWLDKQVRERIEEYLGYIAPGVKHVAKKPLGHKETLEFRQDVAGDKNPWSFLAQNMSDGTLRALGVLVSLFQCFDRPPETPIPLIGIEEPEATLHPAAAGVLMGALIEASHYTQVLLTTHSPDLMDEKDLDPESLLIVDLEKGETIIGPADETSKSVMRDRLYTAGELLKMNQLKPEPKPAESAATDTEPLPLFPND